jgi:precorrin-6B methylase 2
MNTVKESVGVKLQKTPYGRLIGIVENPDQFRAVSEKLKQLGVRDFDLLDGASGIETLEVDQKAVSHFFFGDMEEVMVRRYLAAVKNGHSVFAAVVEPKSVEQVAAMVKALGATEIIHFGEWVITNY